ncbi:MAG: poly(3-hydroxybutyrate) depolymerase [Paraglaciecola sp.]|jgi:poly(3-hydroxybutyrate) depolymerase
MNKSQLTVILIGITMLGVSPLSSASSKLKLDVEHISLSGLSSGGYMATQFQLAHSDWVNGVGIIAAGPYYCAQNDIRIALDKCVNQLNTPIDLHVLSEQAQTWQHQGKLPSLSNLKRHRVWLFNGSKDTKVIAGVNHKLAEQYQRWVAPQNLAYINDKPFAHLFPTLATGGKCDLSAAPFIGNCGYDAAGEMLNFMLGDLQPRVEKPGGELVEIDQQALGGKPAASLADSGYLYVPQSCQDGSTCTVHISFHGCNQNAGAVDKQYAQHTGLNNWADSNHMVVFYPQTKSSMMLPLNPQACWDWWGYTGSDYANQDGPQIKAVANIIHALAK